MPKGGYTSTKHHCPGRIGWVGRISPGNCRMVDLGRLKYCEKHEMPCRNGCFERKHLQSQEGCTSCERAWAAEAKRAREAKQKASKSSRDDSHFWNPPKGRKKEAKKYEDEEDDYFDKKTTYYSSSETKPRDYYYSNTPHGKNKKAS